MYLHTIKTLLIFAWTVTIIKLLRHIFKDEPTKTLEENTNDTPENNEQKEETNETTENNKKIEQEKKLMETLAQESTQEKVDNN